MQGRDLDNLSGQPPERKSPKRVLFWMEIAVLAAGIAGSAALVGADYSIVRARSDVREQYHANPEFVYISRDDPAFPVSERTQNVSWLRRILGDEAVRMILLPRGTTSDAELARVRTMFPEAKVELVPIETKRVNIRSDSSSPSFGLKS
jgi:hypothetical protein